MKMRHVFGALTVAAMTYGMTTGVSIVRAQDHHDPYLADTSPKPVEQSSPKAVEPVVVEEPSPVVSKSTPKDPYIAKTSPKPQKVAHHKNDYGLPKGHITIVGCFYREVDSDGDHAHYMLADAKMGPATTVANQACEPSGNGQLIRLKEADDTGLNQVASNRWVELFGEMGRPRDADDQRKFEVKSFREVPLTPAPRIAVLIAPAPQPQPEARAETPAAQEQAVTESPKPMATTGETPVMKKLPKTASELPLIALLGLFALTGGVALGLIDRQKAFARG
jgi:hypothetical protein